MWKMIDGYEGYYQINEHGEVRSLDRVIVDKSGPHAGTKRLHKGKPMKLTESRNKARKDGYLVVNLRRDHTSHVVPVHVLVAKTFVPNPNGMPTINHIDGNKHNNDADNLEWVSYAENNSHALRNGLRKPRGVRISQYDTDGNYIATYRSVTEASRRTGISRGMISHCVNGRTKSASGFVWKKLSEGATTIPNGSTREDELPVEAQRPSEQTEDIVYAVSNNGTT